ncbi:deazaflavin-dependent oxidoreductase, nitroreductase family [Saccharopolyspora kobensis]|uniref:Deazaflavin-dependent oxidoreductase, nitroreductase family n=1 Tax=Saccharopolyspora kobensis TaxID=146035 RepID=A0A1H6DC13_9PSEU|nr:nitroreductase family deazaflavin-dependent oxidoreductase [Saccharopolyspora kobensis]SEG82714.1 deazaflavin-dependent oxidoreductase, nitroreductase family [Saccharopolyspora kobensis]SFE25881.1 deazaflavin-dependent oxidoreductase, nitroreductase family [Saccharopolyspora kobensis]
MNEQVVREFRANGGKVGGIFDGVPLLLLTTVGARSGRSRTTPAVYLRDGNRFVVFASNGGAPVPPAWYFNLVANPQVVVEVGGATRTAVATVVDGAERDRLWARQVAADPQFAQFQQRAGRLVPVVALEPVA